MGPKGSRDGVLLFKDVKYMCLANIFSKEN